MPEIGIHLAGPDHRPIAATRFRMLDSKGGNGRPPPKSAIWLSDRSILDLNAFGPTHLRTHVRADGWIGPRWQQILAEWKLDREPEARHAKQLASMASRVISLGFLAAAGLPSRAHTAMTFNGTGVLRRHSFSRGLRILVRDRLNASRPAEAALAHVSRDIHQYGMTGLHGRGGCERRMMTFVRCRYSYVSMLAGTATPAPGPWCQVKLPRQHVPLCSQLFDELEALDLPIIIIGAFQPFRLVPPSWVSSWLSGPARPYGRRCFLLEEARRLREHGEFRIRSAFAGSGWQDKEKSLLRMLVHSHERPCGGKEIATLSWSAGLAAENILSALAERPPAKAEVFPILSGWLAAHDRIAAIPAIEAVESCGAGLVSVRACTLKVSVRDTEESLQDITCRLWRLGWWPVSGGGPFEDDLAPGMDGFGGSGRDRDFALAMRGGADGIATELDRFADPRGQKRRPIKKALRKLLQQSSA